MEMSNLVTRLRALKLELFDDILVYLVLISLPAQFSHFKISYNTQKEKWTLNELIAQCVQEEERLKHEKIETTMLPTRKGKGIITIKENELQRMGPHNLRGNKNKIRSSLVSFARKVDM